MLRQLQKVQADGLVSLILIDQTIKLMSLKLNLKKK